ncbi:hypothetical protein [Nonomuraea sp. NPDC050786]|uniref:hypothetical protein n=1 Tax=Nonomuraea sp. NPDC050786 TaxID=3154840 RepID=UPI0033E2991A
MTGILALDICVALGILAGGGAVVWKALAALKRWGNFTDDLFGEPAWPGVDARPGVMERLHAIEAELHPNHGSSLRDAVDGVAATVKRVEVHFEAHLLEHTQKDKAE